MPAEYTLNSPSWRVVDNHFQIITGVDITPARGEMRLSMYPNPVTSASTMSFEQLQASNVRVQVFDLQGRLVRTLADEWRAAGTQRFRWDGRANNGSVAGTGIYFARVEAGTWVATQRIVRVR
jgi:flagellar hook assembly protein FlgD